MVQMMQNLRDLTSDVLCKMFFLTEETEPASKNFNFKYAVCIENDKFSIILVYTEKVARLLTENFLGIDDITDDDIYDTLKEVINIIAGNFIGIYLKNLSDKVPVPYAIKDIKELKTDDYMADMMFFKEDPLKLMLKFSCKPEEF